MNIRLCRLAKNRFGKTGSRQASPQRRPIPQWLPPQKTGDSARMRPTDERKGSPKTSGMRPEPLGILRRSLPGKLLESAREA